MSKNDLSERKVTSVKKVRHGFKLTLILICLVLLLILLGLVLTLGTEGSGQLPELPGAAANDRPQQEANDKNQILNLWNRITDALEGEAKGAVKKFSRREMLDCGVCLQDGVIYRNGKKLMEQSICSFRLSRFKAVTGYS